MTPSLQSNQSYLPQVYDTEPQMPGEFDYAGGSDQPDPNQQGIASSFDEKHLAHTDLEAVAVKAWLARIKQSKDRWAKDFERMRENMAFATGLQWDDQIAIRDKQGRIVVNIALGAVKNKLAQLYAKNPTPEVLRRQRMDFQVWDETVESLVQCYQRSQIAKQMGAVDMEAEATIMDFMNGRKMQRILDKLARTLELALKQQLDTHRPEFKEQMKQLVLRTIITGVGYIIPSLIVQDGTTLSATTAPHNLTDRTRMAQSIMARLSAGDLNPLSEEVETLKSLLMSIGVYEQTNDYELTEHLVFDFPPPTAIIPDYRCRSLKEFIGARYIAHEFCLPVEEVNAFFNLHGDDRLSPGTSASLRDENNRVRNVSEYVEKNESKPSRVNVYRVLDYTTKTEFYVCEGHEYYLQPPAPPEPCLHGFWPVFALTFNNIEVDPDGDNDEATSIFPPSDIDLIRDAQKEWNRTRDALRGQRNANAPTYLVRSGVLSAEDKAKIANRDPNEVIELQGVPPNTKPSEIIDVLQVKAIDPAVYDTAPQEKDMMLGAGVQQANIGPAQPDVTATVGTIAEQSRLSVSASNVDDLDGFLSRFMQACGEMILQGFSEGTVKRIAGVGAVWPSLGRDDFLDQLDISIKAASSGRPNQAMRVATRQQLVPLLLNAGANPIAVIEELVKTMDDTLDVQKFFPLPVPMGGAAPQQAGQRTNGASNGPSGPPHQQMNGPRGAELSPPPNPQNPPGGPPPRNPPGPIGPAVQQAPGGG